MDLRKSGSRFVSSFLTQSCSSCSVLLNQAPSNASLAFRSLDSFSFSALLWPSVVKASFSWVGKGFESFMGRRSACSLGTPLATKTSRVDVVAAPAVSVLPSLALAFATCWQFVGVVASLRKISRVLSSKC